MEGDHEDEDFSPECPDIDASNEEDIDAEDEGAEEEGAEEEGEEVEDEAEEEAEEVEEEADEVEQDEDEQMDQDDSHNKGTENLSTYESISEIATDKLLPKPGITGGGLAAVSPLKQHSMIISEACTSAQDSSMSYNTVPEVHLPAEPETEMDIEALQAQYDMGECGEVQNDSDQSAEDDPNLNEDVPPEAPSTQSSLRGLTGQQSYSQTGSRQKKRSRSQSALGRSKSVTSKPASKREKLKQKVLQSKVKTQKAVSHRDLIRPENKTTSNDPNAPRRPLTAFKVFINEFRREYATKYAGIPFSQMTDIGAEVWRDMPPKRKYQYQSEANKQQHEYLKQMNDYQSKKQHEKSNKPKTAYQLFMSDYLNKEYEKRKNLKTQSRLTKQDLFMRGVRKWNRLTKNQKKPYEEQSIISKNSQSYPNLSHQSAGESSTPNKRPRSVIQLSPTRASVSNLKASTSIQGGASQHPRINTLKKYRVEFSETDEVGQFQPDDTLATWFQAAKRGR